MSPIVEFALRNPIMKNGLLVLSLLTSICLSAQSGAAQNENCFKVISDFKSFGALQQNNAKATVDYLRSIQAYFGKTAKWYDELVATQSTVAKTKNNPFQKSCVSVAANILLLTSSLDLQKAKFDEFVVRFENCEK